MSSEAENSDAAGVPPQGATPPAVMPTATPSISSETPQPTTLEPAHVPVKLQKPIWDDPDWKRTEAGAAGNRTGSLRSGDAVEANPQGTGDPPPATLPQPLAEGRKQVPATKGKIAPPKRKSLDVALKNIFEWIVVEQRQSPLAFVQRGERDSGDCEIPDFSERADGGKLSAKLIIYRTGTPPLPIVAKIVPVEVVPLREHVEPLPEPKPRGKAPKLRRVEESGERDDAPLRQPKPARSSPAAAIFAALAALFAFAACVLGVLSYLKPAASQPADYGQKLDALDRKLDGQTLTAQELTLAVQKKPEPQVILPEKLTADLKKEFRPVKFEEGTDIYIVATNATRVGLDARKFHPEFVKAVSGVPRGADARVRVGFALAEDAKVGDLVKLGAPQVEIPEFQESPGATEQPDFFGGSLKGLFDPKRDDQRAILVTSSVCKPLTANSPGWEKLRELHVVLIPRSGEKVGPTELDNMKEWHDLVSQRSRGSVHLVTAPDAASQKTRLLAVLSQLIPGAK